MPDPFETEVRLTYMDESKAKKNLVLFKSALRDEYKGKVLTALSLPDSFYLHTWYDRKWVSEDLWDQMTKKPKELKRKETSLIFVDQKKKPPVFYPLRRCTLFSVCIRNSRAYLWLGMEKYYNYDDEQLDEFNKKLRKTFQTKLPPNENTYAQFGDITHVCTQLHLLESTGLEPMEKSVRLLTTRAGENFAGSIF